MDTKDGRAPLLDALQGEIQQLRKRQRVCKDTTLSSIDELLSKINSYKAAAAAEGGMEVDAPPAKEMHAITKKMHTDLKALQKPLVKLGKSLDKAFPHNISKMNNPNFPSRQAEVIKGVAEHLFRRGAFQIADTLLQETKETLDSNQRDSFLALDQMLASLSQHDIGPALRWAQGHKGLLRSDLEFKLHRLHFIKLLVDQKEAEASQYCQENFPQFSKSNFTEIKRLMGAFLYSEDLKNSAYSDLLNPHQWEDVASQLTLECCALLGLPHVDPLSLSITAGCYAMPQLVKMSDQLVKTKKQWQPGDQIPIEVNLGDSNVFHSVFACPVSREQTTAQNPPMRLPCGHVYAKNSLQQIARPGRNKKFKCTYCPHEQTMREALQLHF